MIIRTDQMTTLNEAAEEDFELRARETMNECWPEECNALSCEELENLVRAGIDRARAYGLREDNSILNFLNFRFGIDQQFPVDGEHDWAAVILADKYASEPEKINDVLDEIADRY
jgi:hypothetical protein